MAEPNPYDSPASRVVIVLSTASLQAPDAAVLAFRYAATAAAMDVAVEVHAVSGAAVRLFGRGAASDGLLAQIRQATDLGASLFVCPAALADQGLRAEDMIDEVSGVRGAASLLTAGLAPGARPDLIFADEPVASLDPRIGAGILELLRSICHAEHDGVAVICSLHQPHFAKLYADRVVGLAAGRIVMDIAAADFAETSLLNVYGDNPSGIEEAHPSTAAQWATA